MTHCANWLCSVFHEGEHRLPRLHGVTRRTGLGISPRLTSFRSQVLGLASGAVVLGVVSAVELVALGAAPALSQVIFEGLGPGQTDVCTNANGQVVGRTGAVLGVEQCGGGTQQVTGIQVQGANTTTINGGGLTAGVAGSQTIINDNGITTEVGTTSNFNGTQNFGGTNNFSGTQTYSGTNDFTTGLTVSGGSLQVGGVQIDSATGDVTGVNGLAANNISANNSVSAGGHITAGTGVTATNGNITATNGNVNAGGSMNAGGHITAGTGMTATNGNITAQNGNINAANGSVNAAQHVTAGTGVTATNGNITAVNGNVNAGGSVNAGTFVTAKQDVIAGRDAKVGRNLEVIGTGTFGGMIHANGGLTVAPNQQIDMGMNRVQNVGMPIHAFDAANKAYVDGADAKLEEGIAVSLALQNPDLVGAETFGLAMNWGNFEGSNAIGISAAGVLGNNLVMPGDRLAIAGGIGFGLDEDTVGGRVGIQWTR